MFGEKREPEKTSEKLMARCCYTKSEVKTKMNRLPVLKGYRNLREGPTAPVQKPWLVTICLFCPVTQSDTCLFCCCKSCTGVRFVFYDT